MINLTSQLNEFDPVKAEKAVSENSLPAGLNFTNLIKRPGDLKEIMLHEYDFGKKRGETTRLPELDPHMTWKEGFLYTISGWPQHGKALALETPIPTPTGWTTMGELKPGDKLYDENGMVCSVLKATPVQYNRQCFKVVFSDGSEIVADAEHNWFTYDYKARKSYNHALSHNRIGDYKVASKGVNQSHKRKQPAIRTTQEIANTLIASDGKRQNHSIPLTLPIEGHSQSLPIPAYVLGAWLGDGNSDDGGYTTNDIEVLDEIRSYGYEITKRSGPYAYGILNLASDLSKLNVLGNKHVPDSYKRASIADRLALLQGLMDSDGCISPKGRCEFTSVNERLANDTYEIIVSLGMKATLKESRAMLYGKDCGAKYRVCFTPLMPVFRLPRHLARYEVGVTKRTQGLPSRFIMDCVPVESVPVRCIEVDSPNHLFLCGKSMIPTHNSEFMNYLALLKVKFDGWKILVYSPESDPVNEYIDQLAHTMLGENTDKKYTHRAKRGDYEAAIDFLHEYVFVINDDDLEREGVLNSPENLREIARYYASEMGIKLFMKDPWNQLTHDMSVRDDKYLQEQLKQEKRLATSLNIHNVNLVHPKEWVGPLPEGGLPMPKENNLAGGAMWRNKSDVIGMMHRTYYHQDRTDPRAEFATLKVKKQNLVGKPGRIETVFNLKENRYYIDGKCPLITSGRQPDSVQQDLYQYTKPSSMPPSMFDAPDTPEEPPF